MSVKNIARPVRVFQVTNDHLPLRPPTSASRRPRGAAAGALLALPVALAVAAVVWILTWQQEPESGQAVPPVHHDRPSIAVLPFSNMSEDDGQDYFADGLTDDLITDLSKVSGLFVISRNSSFTFKGKAVRVADVARDLGVRYVVEGSVQREGEQLRVNATLNDTVEGHNVWAERYHRSSSDLFAVQDEVVGHIVSALSVKLTRSERNTLRGEPETSLQAYEYYLKAREGYFSRDMVRMRDSLRLFSMAWTEDPEFARAYAGYARLAAEIWRVSAVRGLSSTAMRRAAEVAARKAMSLDDTLAEPHSVLALLAMVNGQHEEAVSLARRAVDLEPNSAEAQATLALVLVYAGRPVEALDAIRTAMRLDPKPPPTHLIYFGLILFMNGAYADAVAVLEPLAETTDRGLGDAPREILAMALAENGEVEQARAQIDAMRRVEIFLNLNYYRVVYNHHARPEDVARRLDALRQAGLPEWPLDYRVDDRTRLAGPQLHDLIDSATWTGTDLGRQGSFVEEFGDDDSAVYAGPNSLLNGTAVVRGDELCEQFEGFVLGRELCGPVFVRSPAAEGAEVQYSYVNPATVREFSVEQ